MTSISRLKEETNRIAKAAWVTLGMSFDYPMIDEKAEGIIDVEALIIATLLVMEKDRLTTDLPAWINRFSSLINFQKLKSVFRGLSEESRRLILANLPRQGHLTGTPKAFRVLFSLKTDAAGTVDETIELRTRKINTIENAARVSLMLKNRLVYGTGFRADLITLIHIENIGMKGTDLARLLCANNSTISRILNDLKASRFLSRDGERSGPFEPYPGMFISVLSIWNLCELFDAVQFSLDELVKGTLENLNFKHDGFCRKVLGKLF